MGVGFNMRRTGKRKLVLFDNGVLSPKLGGLKEISNVADNYAISGNVIWGQVSGNRPYSRTGYFGFNNPISTKGYKFIHFEAACSAYVTYNYVGINTDNTASYAAGTHFTQTSRHVITVPIFDYQGNYYVLFSVWAPGDPISLTESGYIYRIWLDNSETGE